MIELTVLGSILRGISVLYWALAVTALFVAIRYGNSRRAKIVWGLVAVGVFGFFPAKEYVEKLKRDAYEREAWAYFKKKCDTEAGEKIYKTFTGVKSVLVVKPLPPATEKDLFDQYWYGDPYSASAHSQRGKYEAAILASPSAPISFGQSGRGFDFVESVVPSKEESGNAFVKYFYMNGEGDQLQESIDRPISRFAISWEDISSPEDRKYWIAGSRLLVIDLSDSSIVAERIGYFIEGGFGAQAGQRRPWLTSRRPGTTCPPIRNGNFEDRWFILKVLNPIEVRNVK